MVRKLNFFMLGFLLSATLGCMPDLQITNFETTGSAYLSDGSAVVPVRVTIKNAGNESADVFKTAAFYMGSNTTPYVVRFSVPGQTNTWYPYTSSQLAAGGEETFEGNLTFNSTYHDLTVSIWAEADSCSGDEFMPDYCRVEESNENNNESNTINVYLP